MLRHLALLLVLQSLLPLAIAGPASACACCTDIGHRFVENEPFDSRRRANIGEMSFAGVARLKAGAADMELPGIQDAREAYRLTVMRETSRMVFALVDDRGRSGTLTLAMPKSISLFEVDPREDEKQGGTGPALYKEWRLTGPAMGDGLFRDAVGPGRLLTLILHGRGNACTSPSDFQRWTVLIHGGGRPIVTLLGNLNP